MHLEYDLYAHIDGVDYQLCGRPFEIRVREMELDVTLALEDTTRELIVDRDYILKWSSPECCMCTIFHAHKMCRFKAFGETQFRSLPFDTVCKITVHQEEEVTHAALAKLLRQNMEITERLNIMMLMYQKMCGIIVEVDDRVPKRPRL